MRLATKNDALDADIFEVVTFNKCFCHTGSCIFFFIKRLQWLFF